MADTQPGNTQPKLTQAARDRILYGRGRRKYDHVHPLDVVRRAIAPPYSIDRIAILLSCGKDATAVLALCCEHLHIPPSAIRPFFMYTVPNLSFQERYLTYLERRFSVTITRIPHWALSRLLRASAFRHGTAAATSVKLLRPSHVDAYIRRETGCHWIATGEKRTDSIERNAMITQCEGISTVRGRIWPVGYWTDQDANSYLCRMRMMRPPDYRLLPRLRSGGSFSDLISMREAVVIKSNYPDDWRKICEMFPLAEAQVVRAGLVTRGRGSVGADDGETS